MSNAITIQNMAVTTPWIILIPTIAVLLIVIGAGTLSADVISVLKGMLIGKIVAATGIKRKLGSGLVDGIKQLWGWGKKYRFVLVLLVNVGLAILVRAIVKHYEK